MDMTDIPQDLSDALKKTGLDGFFSECTPAHRKEYLKWIIEAKKPETRRARIEKTVQMISIKRAEERTRAKKRP